MHRDEKFRIGLVSELVLNKNKAMGLAPVTPFRFEAATQLLWEANQLRIDPLYGEIYKWSLVEYFNSGSYMKADCPIRLKGSGRWEANDAGGRYKPFRDICIHVITEVERKEDNYFVLLNRLMWLLSSYRTETEVTTGILKTYISRGLQSKAIWDNKLPDNAIAKAIRLANPKGVITEDFVIEAGFCRGGVEQFKEDNKITASSMTIKELAEFLPNYPVINKIITAWGKARYLPLAEVEEVVEQ